MTALVIAIAVAFAFNISNGFHDSANAIAALVATRAARPLSAIALAATFTVLGPIIAGTAVANTVGGIVTVAPSRTIAVVGAGLTGGLVWNLLTWWWGLPSSSSHSLVGGLVGAATLQAGRDAVRWGGFDGWRPVGVGGVLAALAISPILGFGLGFAVDRLARRSLRRARREINSALRRGEWITSSALAFSHGANDGEKAMGVVTLLLVASGHLSHFSVPLWVTLTSAATLTIGTSLGGWRIVKTVGSGIYRIGPLDGLVSQGTSAAVIFGAAALGAPVSTSHVVASSVVGIGASQRRHHVRWTIVREMGLAWILTLPAAAVLGALALPIWRAFA